MNKLMVTRPSLYYSELTKKTLAAAVEKRLSLDEDHFDKAQRAALGQLAQEILAVSGIAILRRLLPRCDMPFRAIQSMKRVVRGKFARSCW